MDPEGERTHESQLSLLGIFWGQEKQPDADLIFFSWVPLLSTMWMFWNIYIHIYTFLSLNFLRFPMRILWGGVFSLALLPPAPQLCLPLREQLFPGTQCVQLEDASPWTLSSHDFFLVWRHTRTRAGASPHTRPFILNSLSLFPMWQLFTQSLSSVRVSGEPSSHSRTRVPSAPDLLLHGSVFKILQPDVSFPVMFLFSVHVFFLSICSGSYQCCILQISPGIIIPFSKFPPVS